MKRELKKSVIYGLYAISFTLLIGGVAILGITAGKIGNKDYKYVSKGILDFEEKVPVVNVTAKIVRPYTDDKVKIVKNFYNYQDESSNQEKSLIYYQGIYMPSTGIAYASGEEFDIVVVYDGKVKEIKEDSILGNVITIEHENGVVSVYQSVTDIGVNEGDIVLGGSMIAKSSTSNISTDLGNHLYFELIVNGECVNPENYYGKKINEL